MRCGLGRGGPAWTRFQPDQVIPPAPFAQDRPGEAAAVADQAGAPVWD